LLCHGQPWTSKLAECALLMDSPTVFFGSWLGDQSCYHMAALCHPIAFIRLPKVSPLRLMKPRRFRKCGLTERRMSTGHPFTSD
jgi:hypothetical protein